MKRWTEIASAFLTLEAGGAAVAAAAAFLPSFVIMMAVLPMLARLRTLTCSRMVSPAAARAARVLGAWVECVSRLPSRVAGI